VVISVQCNVQVFGFQLSLIQWEPFSTRRKRHCTLSAITQRSNCCATRLRAARRRRLRLVMKMPFVTAGVVKLKMPKKNQVVKAAPTPPPAKTSKTDVASKRPIASSAGEARKVKPRAASSAADSDCEGSPSSDDGSDPDDDVDEEDLVQLDGLCDLDRGCLRDASRERVAPKTRTLYDQFIGLMAVFALSIEEYKNLVIRKQDVVTFTLPLSIQFVSAYLTHVEDKRVQWPGEAIGKVKPVSPNYYKAVVLSIHDLYTCEQVLMSDELSMFLFSKRKKFVRSIQDMRCVGTYPVASDRYLTSEGYSHLAKTVVQCSARDFGGWAVQAFACLWTYIILLWNLMARCDRIARLRWADFGWYKDALSCFVCKSKCDQAGANAFHKKLYYNERNPQVCPVTAVAVAFFSREDDSLRCDFVFPRSDTRRNDARYLSKIIKSSYDAASHTSLFGCDPTGITWHYFKRGAFTYLSGLTDACSFAATKMRADHKVLDVSRVYTFFGQGQDGVIGRLLSLLPYGEQEFIGCAPLLSGVDIVWADLVSDWDTLNDKFKYTVVPRLFACLVWRYEWLRQNLPTDHPLWHSRVEASGKLLECRPNVALETRPLTGVTGVSLEMKNAVRLSAISSAISSEQVHVSTPPPVVQATLTPVKPPSVRDDLGLRLLTPLPANERVVPHLTCQQAWRAWFLTTDSLPFPLRYAEGRLTLGSDVTALSRIKTVMNTLSLGLRPSDILEHPEATFNVAFAHLQTQLFQIDESFLIYPYNTCSTIEKKLRDAKARGWCPTSTWFSLGAVITRPQVYDAVDAKDRQTLQRERHLRATKQFQCDRCASLCMHCMHCDTCVKRIDAAVGPANPDPAVSCPAQVAAVPPANPNPVLNDAVAPLTSKSAGVRCLRCKTIYFDKSGYNRHLKTHPECSRNIRFEYVYRTIPL
jgi:hypothetical protein